MAFNTIDPKILELDKKREQERKRLLETPTHTLCLQDQLIFKTEKDKQYKEEFEKRQEWVAFLCLEHNYTQVPKEDYLIYFAEFLNKFYAREVKSFVDYMEKEGFKPCSSN